MFKQHKQDSMNGIPMFPYAVTKANLVSTRFYVNEIDITLAMREKIYKDRYHKGKPNSEKPVNALINAETSLFDEFMECVIGNTPEYDENGFGEYIELAKQVNGYVGEVSPKEAFSENVAGFRKLVKELVNARKKVGLRASFTSTYISEGNNPWLNQEVITYEKALKIAEEILDNYVILRYGNEYIDEESLMEELCLEETSLRDVIQEKFLNQNSFSIKSLFGTVSDYDNMLDNELLYLIEDGLSLDMLAYMLKHFAKTGKDIKKV